MIHEHAITGPIDGRITKIGRYLVRDGKIGVIGFDGKGVSCRELFILALEHARETGIDLPGLDEEIAAVRAEPGGGKGWID